MCSPSAAVTNASAFGADELVEDCDRVAARDGDVHCVHDTPLDSDEIAGVAEQILDVLGAVRELVARVAVLPVAVADRVGRAATVGLDQAF